MNKPNSLTIKTFEKTDNGEDLHKVDNIEHLKGIINMDKEIKQEILDLKTYFVKSGVRDQVEFLASKIAKIQYDLDQIIEKMDREWN